MRLNRTFFTLLIFSALNLISQELPPPTLGSKALKLGDELYNDERYDRAILEYQKVAEWDTSYCKSLIHICWAHYSTDQYEELIESSKELIRSCKDSPKGKEFLGIALVNLERYDEAIEVFNSALEQWPFYDSYYINKASAHRNNKQAQLAFLTLKELLNFSPFNANGHAELSTLCRENGLLVEAALALSASILFELNDERALQKVILLDNLLAGKAEISNIPVPLDSEDNFKKIAQLVQSNVALDKKYKTPSKLKFPIVKQNHLILDQLRKNKSKGYFSQFYKKAFTQIIEDENYALFSYALLHTSRNEKAMKVIKKKKSDVIEFWIDFKNTWREANNFTELEKNGPDHPVHLWFSDELVFTGFGGDKELTVPYDVRLFDVNGALVLTGESENGMINGACQLYYSDGTLWKQLTEIEGLLQGSFTEYHRNGEKKKAGSYKDNEAIGEWKEYFLDGTISSEYHFSNGMVAGIVKEYHPTGFLEYEYTKEKEIFNGPYKIYFPNGMLRFEAEIESGLKKGISKSYYANGQLESQQNSIEGNAEGTYNSYFINGELKETGEFKDDLQTGEWKLFNARGMQLSSSFFSKGELDGPASFNHTITGKSQYRFVYSKDVAEQIILFDDKGQKKVITAQRGKIDFPFIQDFTQFSGEGRMNNGKKEGVWMYSDAYHQVREKTKYLNGLQEGLVKRYYSNGDKSEQFEVKKDSVNGWYYYYSPGNKVFLKNGFIGNQRCGASYAYYPNDSLLARFNWRFDMEHGLQTTYYPNGEKESEKIYEDGLLIKWSNYGPDGVLWFSDSTISGTHTYQEKYQNGMLAIRQEMKNNIADGDYFSYNSNGMVNYEGGYVNNQKEGWWIKYHPNGVVEDSSFFMNGVLHGKKSVYYSNGGKAYSYFFNNGYQHKEYTRYTPESRIGRRTEFEYGVKHGTSKLFSRSGDLQYEEYFRNGLLIGYAYEESPKNLTDTIFLDLKDTLLISYYPNGDMAASVPFKNGTYQGLVQYWYPNGKLEYEAFYDMGEPTGKIRRFFESGNPSFEGEYRHGIQIGEEKTFDLSGKLIEFYSYINGNRNGPFSIESINTSEMKIPAVKGTILGNLTIIE